MTDNELVCRAAAGDRDALSELLDRCGQALARRVEREIGPRWRGALDVDDVLQVTYLEAFLQTERLLARDARSFFAWLVRIALNNLRDAIRGLESERRPPLHRRLPDPGHADPCHALLNMLSASATTPSRVAAGGELKGLLQAALARLPRDYAEVIRLFDLEGLSAREVGRRMGRSRGAIHMLRARAIQRLREFLGSGSKFFSDVT